MPTAEQQQVLQSAAQAAIISALAGCGKTTTLCMKACELLSGLGSEARILVLAYSRAGVTAFRDRMIKLNRVVPAQLDILTIEQLCEHLLAQQGDPVKKLDNPVHQRFLILQAQQALGLQRDSGATASALSETAVDIDAFLAFEALAKKRLLERQWQDSNLGLQAFCDDMDLDYDLFRLYQQYERMRVGMNHEPQFYAEGDCSFEICRQLDTMDWDQPFEWLDQRYQAVLFDELHDLDEAALTVLRKLVQSNNGFFVGAGDFNQHIHEGAFSVFGASMQRIKACLPADTELLKISRTRRFGAEICDALNPLFAVDFLPAPDRPGMFQRMPYDSDAHCAQQLVELHTQIVNGWGRMQAHRGGQHSTLNVILRNPQDSILLEWVFGHEGVHYGCQGMRAFYLRREVALILTLMWALQGGDGAPPLTRGIVHAAIDGLLHYGLRHTPALTVNPDVLAQGQFDDAGQWDNSLANESLALASALYQHASRMRRFIVQGSLNPQAALLTDSCAQVMDLPRELLGDAGALCRHPLLRRIFDDALVSERQRRACLESLDSLAHIADGLPVSEFLGRLGLIASASIDMLKRKETISLRLMSVDASKGREFTFVAVPFVQRGRFPRTVAHAHAYMERNMLYVALTRADSALWLLESSSEPIGPGPL